MSRIGSERGWSAPTRASFLHEVEHGSMVVGSPETAARKIAAGVKALRTILDRADWIDGNETSGPQAALAKRNRQIAEDSAAAQEAGALILDALARHKDRCAGGAGQQGGLVTHFMGGAVGQGLAAIGGAAAIAARDNARLPAVLLQIGDHGLGDGGFASPASNHIAHDDDGHPGVDGALAAGMPSL